MKPLNNSGNKDFEYLKVIPYGTSNRTLKTNILLNTQNYLPTKISTAINKNARATLFREPSTSTNKSAIIPAIPAGTLLMTAIDFSITITPSIFKYSQNLIHPSSWIIRL